MPIPTDWHLTPQRVAIHVSSGTAVLADLHLGYHSARRRRGEAVPVPALDELLEPLAAVLKPRSLSRIVVAGDLFEDGVDDQVLAGLLDWLLRNEINLFAVVPGNHDRRLTIGAPGIAVFPNGFELDRWLVVHGDGDLPDRPLVCGHWHPSLRVGKQNHPCYLVSQRRIVLPAFSREARGVVVNGRGTWQDCSCHVPVGDEVLDFGNLTKSGQSSSRAR